MTDHELIVVSYKVGFKSVNPIASKSQATWAVGLIQLNQWPVSIIFIADTFITLISQPGVIFTKSQTKQT